MTRLSIVIPTNRDNELAYATIMRACSWASPEIEIIVRDNSGSAKKRDLLDRIDRASCKAIYSAPCDVNTNFQQALLAADGDFVLFMGDDDACFDRGIAAIAAAAIRCVDDLSVVALTGAYALEEAHASQIVGYSNIDSPDVIQRLDGYLAYQGPNLIFYSAVRRPLIVDTFDFIYGHPFQFSFHDHFFSLIYLLSGRFINVGRLAFIYDNANWAEVGVGAQNDLKVYQAAGMDPIIRQLHWLLCGFEGASIILWSRFGARHPLVQRQVLANRWFELMFRRFAGDTPNSYGSNLTQPANAIRERLLRSYPNFSLDTLLADICEFIGLFSPEKAQRYHDFWKSIEAKAAP